MLRQLAQNNTCGNGSETLLASRVPNLKLNLHAINGDCFDFKVDPNRRNKGGRKHIVAKPHQKTAFADP